MKPDIAFRIAVKQDAQAIADLVNSAYRGESSRSGWTTEADFLAGQRTDKQAVEEIIANPTQWFLLGERGSVLLGSVCLERFDPQRCYFGMFAVRPELQAQGIGKRFVLEAERFAREELRCSTMRMLVITLRSELIAWYERRGYRRTGELDAFPYGDEHFGIPLRDDLRFEVLTKSL